MKNCKNLRHCVRVYSLPADVLWGLFVTHSFLPPWGRNEYMTNEPQRTSAGRLEGVQNCLALFQTSLSEVSNYNNNYSHIYSCLWIDKQPVREYAVRILNFLKAFFWSSLTHISQLRCLHYFGHFVSIPHTFGAHAVNLSQVYTNWYLQAILFSPSSTHSLCLFVLVHDKCYKVSLCSKFLSVIDYYFVLHPIKKIIKNNKQEKKNIDNPIKKDPLWTIVRTKHKLKFHHTYFIIKNGQEKRLWLVRIMKLFNR